MAPKLVEFGGITQNNGHYGVYGHSRSLILVPVESPYVISERELMFTFAICRRPSVCLSSVTFVHPTQPIEIFGNVSVPCNTLVT